MDPSKEMVYEKAPANCSDPSLFCNHGRHPWLVLQHAAALVKEQVGQQRWSDNRHASASGTVNQMFGLGVVAA